MGAKGGIDFGTIAGFGVGVLAVFGLACKWELGSYFDAPSVGLVFGGCVTSVLIAVPMNKIKKMPGTFLRAFRSPPPQKPEDTINYMVKFAERARRDGLLALEGEINTITDPYTRQGLQLAVDGTPPETIEQILNSRTEEIDRRHSENRRGWELVRGSAPSWGAMGTVIGLVQMVKGGVEDPNALIMGIAVALLTTFYGSLIASWFVGPVVDKLSERSSDETLSNTLTLRGILSIQAGDMPRVVEQKLWVFLNSSRKRPEEEEAK